MPGFRSRGQLARAGTHVSRLERDAQRLAAEARRESSKIAWLFAAGAYRAAAHGYRKEGRMDDARRMDARRRKAEDRAGSRVGPARDQVRGRQTAVHNPPMGYTKITARVYYRQRKGYLVHVISHGPPDLTAAQVEQKIARTEGGRWEAAKGERWKKMRGSLGREGWMERPFYRAGY